MKPNKPKDQEVIIKTHRICHIFSIIVLVVTLLFYFSGSKKMASFVLLPDPYIFYRSKLGSEVEHQETEARFISETNDFAI